MIHTAEMFRLLKQMEAVVHSSATMTSSAVWTDEAAIRQLAGLLSCSLNLISKEPIPEPAAVALTNPASQSSVQIEQAAKGPPRLTVKVYSADAAEALVEATTLYDQAVAKYAAKESNDA